MFNNRFINVFDGGVKSNNWFIGVLIWVTCMPLEVSALMAYSGLKS